MKGPTGTLLAATENATKAAAKVENETNSDEGTLAMDMLRFAISFGRHLHADEERAAGGKELAGKAGMTMVCLLMHTHTSICNSESIFQAALVETCGLDASSSSPTHLLPPTQHPIFSTEEWRRLASFETILASEASQPAIRDALSAFMTRSVQQLVENMLIQLQPRDTDRRDTAIPAEPTSLCKALESAMTAELGEDFRSLLTYTRFEQLESALVEAALDEAWYYMGADLSWKHAITEAATLLKPRMELVAAVNRIEKSCETHRESTGNLASGKAKEGPITGSLKWQQKGIEHQIDSLQTLEWIGIEIGYGTSLTKPQQHEKQGQPVDWRKAFIESTKILSDGAHAVFYPGGAHAMFRSAILATMRSQLYADQHVRQALGDLNEMGKDAWRTYTLLFTQLGAIHELVSLQVSTHVELDKSITSADYDKLCKEKSHLEQLKVFIQAAKTLLLRASAKKSVDAEDTNLRDSIITQLQNSITIPMRNGNFAKPPVADRDTIYRFLANKDTVNQFSSLAEKVVGERGTHSTAH